MPLLDLAVSAATPFLASVLGASWAPRHCSCSCAYARGASDFEVQLLSVLSKQLDRCGPEQLHREPCPQATCVDPVWHVLLGLILGVAFTLLGVRLLGTREAPQLHKAPAPLDAVTPSTAGRARRPPGSLAVALKDADA
jgi:hypothetical protein